MIRQSKTVIIIAVVLALSIGIGYLASTHLRTNPPCTGLGEIAFVSDQERSNEIHLINAGCSQEARVFRTFCDGSAGPITWTPDGKQIVYVCTESSGMMSFASGIHVIDPETNRRTMIIDCRKRKCAGSRGITSELHWTHGGACLAWLTWDSTQPYRVEMSWSADGEPQNPVCAGWGAKSPAGDYHFVHYSNEPCSPNGKYCLYADWDPDRGLRTYLVSMSGVSSPITEDFIHRDVSGIYPVLDTSGTLLENDVFHRAAWSPNSEHVALTLFDGQAFTSSLYLVDARHPRMVQMAAGLNISEGQLTWSPDSRWVAFIVEQGDNGDIYVLDSQTGEVRHITTDAANDYSPTWRPLPKSN